MKHYDVFFKRLTFISSVSFIAILWIKVSSLFFISPKSQVQLLEKKIDRLELEKEISNILLPRYSCSKSLYGTQLSDEKGFSKIKHIVNYDGTIAVPSNAQYNNLYVGQIRIKELPRQAIDVGGSAQVEISIPLRKETYTNVDLKPINFVINIKVDENRRITGCI